MSMCRVFSCVVGRGCLLWPVCSLGITLLAFALLHSVLQGQICLLLQVSTSCFCIPVPYNEKDIFFGWDGRRSEIFIKSNPIHTVWVTHELKNNYTKEVFPQERKFWAPHLVTKPRIYQEEDPPENLTFKAKGVWSQEFHRTGGNRNFSLGGHTKGLVYTRIQGIKVVTA